MVGPKVVLSPALYSPRKPNPNSLDPKPYLFFFVVDHRVLQIGVGGHWPFPGFRGVGFKV